MLIEIKDMQSPLNVNSTHIWDMMVRMRTQYPIWKTSMTSMDAIHVHAKEGGEHDEIRGNIALETNDCL